MDWYTIVTDGGATNPTPARGPWKSYEDADAAILAFRERHGHLAGTYLAATNARIVGPYRTRRAALEADISTATPARDPREA